MTLNKNPYHLGNFKFSMFFKVCSHLSSLGMVFLYPNLNKFSTAVVNIILLLALTELKVSTDQKQKILDISLHIFVASV